MIAAATRTASCDRPPVSDTMAVRGGLALTGNPPIRPDRMLPTPTPMKSRSTSGGWSGSDTNDRVVAAVCTMTMMAMMRVSGTSCSHRPIGTSGMARVGSATGILPRTATPRLSSPSRMTTMAAAAISPSRAPGMRASIRSAIAISASTPRPMPSAKGLACGSCSSRVARRCSIAPCGEGKPEDGRHLRDQDVNGDAGEKADRDRDREQIGDPAKTENAAGDQHETDHQRQRAGKRRIFRRAGHGQQREAAGKDRRDGRIGAARQQAVAAESGKGQRAGKKREKPDLRRKPAQPRCCELFGDGDGGERDSGDQVAGQKRQTIALQGAQHRPAIDLVRTGGCFDHQCAAPTLRPTCKPATLPETLPQILRPAQSGDWRSHPVSERLGGTTPTWGQAEIEKADCWKRPTSPDRVALSQESKAGACFIASAATEQPCTKAGSDHNRRAGHRDGGLDHGYGGDGGSSICDVDALDSARARADRDDVDLEPAICLDAFHQAPAGSPGR